MTMLYPQQTRKKKPISRTKLVVIVFFIILFLIYIYDGKIIMRPFQAVALKMGFVKNTTIDFFTNIFSIFVDKKQLSRENILLEDKYNNFNLICTSAIKNLETKVAELTNALKRKDELGGAESITAFVIGKPPLTPYDTIMIDIGEAEGVKVGDLVLVGKLLIGDISQVFRGNSSVRIYGKRGEDLNLLLGEKRLVVVGKGLGMGVVKTKVINNQGSFQDQAVRIQHNSGYIFGFVDRVESRMGDQYQDLTIKSPINIFELGSVEVLRNDK